jgi:hypothetical protein
MRVEVEIGTIEIDALPEGTTEEALRASVKTLLEQQVLGFRPVANHVAAPRRGQNVESPEPTQASNTLRLAREIARAVTRELKR